MDDTNEQDTDPAPRNEPRFHARTAAIVAGGFVLLLLAFVAGIAIGDDDGPGGRFERQSARGEMPHRGRGGGEGMGMRGGPGMRGEDGRGMGGGKGMGRGKGPGMGMGGGPGGGHGAMGVVESAGADSLTIDPLRGGSEAIEVSITSDTTVTRSGEDGPRDLEEASIEDVDEGDIVAVRPARDDAGDDDTGDDDEQTRTITAAQVMILRDADA